MEMARSRDTSPLPIEGVSTPGPTDLQTTTSNQESTGLLLLSLNSGATVHQRRRVNPESLALRLGPDLVRDLEALILPGVIEMPSFAVRKELQERYSIDRRHIYDYFHSRGLRVIKEDKNGNLIIPKEPGPILPPNLRPLRQAPLKDPSRPHSTHTISSDTKWISQKSRGITKARPGRPRKNANSVKKTISDRPGQAGPLSCTSAHRTHYTVNPLTQDHYASIVGEDQDHDFVSGANPLDDSFSLVRAIGDVSYSYRHKPVFERMHELYDLEASAASLAHKLEASLALELERDVALFGENSCGSTSPYRRPLLEEDGPGFYQFLSDALGPARGIQECIGTYKSHMQERSRLFYEGLLSAPYTNSHHSHRSRPAQSQDHHSTLRDNEYRLWLSSSENIDKHGGHAVSRNRHSLPSGGMRKVRQKSAVGAPYIRPHADRKALQIGNTLDELFPALAEDGIVTDITRSPVVRTHCPPYVCPDYLSFLHDSSAVDEDSEEAVTWPVAGDPSSNPLSADTGTPSASELRGHMLFPGATAEPPFPAYSKDARNLEHSGSLLQPASLLSDAFETSNHAAEDTTGSTPRVTRASRKTYAQTRFVPCSPAKRSIRDRERVKTRSVTSRGTRLRTTSAGGGI
ncbi:hypothetical protein BV22DRAFT_1131091 [Leucogyrophana mollusca]|uniref:Uncharacterized protein n=1 Tax=Leucogyrophana mollusca TaxID=85980 RepID=A0ACB8BCI5_9AGAM|nr:hypothetical protein BV22DRAFT_1131091 [Leucogyrophana mollusca]